MTNNTKFSLKTTQCKWAISALILVTILMVGFNPDGGLAQCGGVHPGNRGGQHMVSTSGHMGSGQMGMQGTQTPVQPDPNAACVAPAQPPVPGHTMPQNGGARGLMTGPGGTVSGHSGHLGH